MYKTDGADYEMICSFLGWDATIHPVKVMRKKNTVRCTGTVLHPEEWSQLASFNAKRLPDGSTLKITNIPDRI